MSYDGSTLKYWWKWNTAGGESDIRYSWEALNDTSGAVIDPLNHYPMLEYLEKMSTVLPSADFTSHRHFLAELYNSDSSV